MTVPTDAELEALAKNPKQLHYLLYELALYRAVLPAYKRPEKHFDELLPSECTHIARRTPTHDLKAEEAANPNYGKYRFELVYKLIEHAMVDAAVYHKEPKPSTELTTETSQRILGYLAYCGYRLAEQPLVPCTDEEFEKLMDSLGPGRSYEEMIFPERKEVTHTDSPEVIREELGHWARGYEYCEYYLDPTHSGPQPTAESMIKALQRGALLICWYFNQLTKTKDQIWVVDSREAKGETVMCELFRSKECALDWIARQRPSDWSGSWFGLYVQAVQDGRTDITFAQDMEFYWPGTCVPLENQPG